jgi:N-methylhydantoinase A
VKTAPCTFDSCGAVATPRYDRAGLAVGSTLGGPAIVEDASSTVIVPPGATLTADAHGHLHIETGTAP